MSDISKYAVTRPKRIARDMHICEGLLRGISADGHIGVPEAGALGSWLEAHREFSRRPPFAELVNSLEAALRAGLLAPDTQADLIWLCQRFSTPNAAYDAVTASMQRLQGYLAGLIADGHVTEAELHSLQAWLDEHTPLRGLWPYDEVSSLVTTVMADQRIDPDEEEKLVAYFADFAELQAAKSGGEANFTLSGVCAVAPTLEFPERVFCFTGDSARAKREDMKAEVRRRGAEARDSVSIMTDYLIVGAAGSQCWAFACYGRKVEQAVNLRREGHRILIVHENDFWDAVA